MKAQINHKPVLLKEVILLLEPKNGDIFIDATFGTGGHSKEILKYIMPDGMLIGFEKNEKTFQIIEEIYKGDKIKLFRKSFEHIYEICKNLDLIYKVDKILFDLGLSTFLIKSSGLGFSYKLDEPLDMRYSEIENKPLSYWINRLSFKEICNILKHYGEVKHAKKFAREIIFSRPIHTTSQLSEIIKKVSTKEKLNKNLKKIFQAFRIFINDELNTFKKGLCQAQRVLKVNGKIAIITYQSLEDKVIKEFLLNNPLVENITKKPIRPQKDELSSNPSSRSAKLWIIRKK